jgi:hypothetical protein
MPGQISWFGLIFSSFTDAREALAHLVLSKYRPRMFQRKQQYDTRKARISSQAGASSPVAGLVQIVAALEADDPSLSPSAAYSPIQQEVCVWFKFCQPAI